MASSNDPYFYDNYYLDYYEDSEGPPLIEKRSRLIAAVVQNQIGVLEDLLDSPEWYNVADKYGLTLLQIAILTDNKEVFDYMMSIPDFPIDFLNSKGESALVIALDYYVSNDIWMSQHFAYELIKNGASVDVVCFEGNPPLHRALERSYDKVATLLIQKGVDVNVLDSEGFTPLEAALDMYKGVEEVVSALLLHRAVACTDKADTFESSVQHKASFSVQEMLFLYTFDKSFEVEINLHVILLLAIQESPLFHELLKYPFKVCVSDYKRPYFYMLTSMNIDYLKIVIENFADDVREAFSNNTFISFDTNKTIHLENLELMLESDLRSDVISIITSIRSIDFFKEMEPNLTESYCYLLSYGLNIEEHDLQKVYSLFGCCELFKILLHMDITMNVEDDCEKSVVPVLFYDVTRNFDELLERSYKWDCDTIKELLSYFAHPRLKEKYLHLVDTEEIVGSRNLPDVPLLTEVARNVFRKYFIKFFQIKTSRKFYTLLNYLPVNMVYKKIISYEKKLYKNIFYAED